MLSNLSHRYALIFVDDYSRYTWVYLIKNKKDVYYVFLQFEQFIHLQFNQKILAFHLNWEGEYRKLNTYFKQVDIVHRLACPHTHEQNSVAEHKIRHLVDTNLALLAHANLPLRYWNYAFEMSCSSINNLLTPVLNNSFPYFVLFHKHPDYSTQKPFGCTIFPLLGLYNNHKFAFRSTPYVYLGPSPSHSGSQCLNLSNDRVYIARHVVFNPSLFLYRSHTAASQAPKDSSNFPWLHIKSVPLLSTGFVGNSCQTSTLSNIPFIFYH